MRLKDKAAIVTGAASGIGRATAQLFANEGARVLAVDLPGKGLADAHHDNEAIFTLELSVADQHAPKTIVDTAVAKCGRLDIVMNNAGVASNALAEQMTREVWDRT